MGLKKTQESPKQDQNTSLLEPHVGESYSGLEESPRRPQTRPTRASLARFRTRFRSPKTEET